MPRLHIDVTNFTSKAFTHIKRITASYWLSTPPRTDGLAALHAPLREAKTDGNVKSASPPFRERYLLQLKSKQASQGRSVDLWLGALTCTDKVHGVLPELALGEVIDLGEQRPTARRIIRPFAPGRLAPLDAERREQSRRAHLRSSKPSVKPANGFRVGGSQKWEAVPRRARI